MNEPQPVRGRRPARLAILLPLLALAAAGLFYGTLRLLPAPDLPPLPPLPDLAGRTPAVRDHVTRAHRAAAEEPEGAAEVLALATALHADGFPTEALPAYDRAVALSPGEWRARYLRGLLREEMGLARDAAGDFAAALELRPDFRLAALRLGIAEHKLGNLGEAEAAFRAAMAVPPGAPPSRTDAIGAEVPVEDRARLGLARVHLDRGEREAALALLAEVRERQSLFAPGHVLYAQVLEEMGREEMAYRVRVEATGARPFVPPRDPEIDALARESCDTSFLLRLLTMETRAGNWERAEFLARRAVAVAPGDLDAAAGLAEFLWQAGRYDEAIPVILDLEPRSPDRATVRARLVESWLRANRAADAAKWCREMMGKEPESALLRGLLGNVLRRIGKFVEAEKEYLSSLALAEDDEFRVSLGMCRAALKRYDEAILDFEAVMARQPDDSATLGYLVWALLTAGRDQEAADRAGRLLELDPTSAPAALALARAALREGRREDARAFCLQALRYWPDYADARRLLSEISR